MSRRHAGISLRPYLTVVSHWPSVVAHRHELEEVDFSDEFSRFVQVHVPSVEEAELLLAQYRSPEGARGPEQARFQQAFGAQRVDKT